MSTLYADTDVLRGQRGEWVGPIQEPVQVDVVVISELHRAFYGNQYLLTIPPFELYGVALRVPEVGGPIDPGTARGDGWLLDIDALDPSREDQARLRALGPVVGVFAAGYIRVIGGISHHRARGAWAIGALLGHRMDFLLWQPTQLQAGVAGVPIPDGA